MHLKHIYQGHPVFKGTTRAYERNWNFWTHKQQYFTFPGKDTIMRLQSEYNFPRQDLKTGMDVEARSENGCETGMFWSELGFTWTVNCLLSGGILELKFS